MNHLKLIAAIALLCSAAANAQEQKVKERPTFNAVPTASGWVYSIIAGSVSFDAQAAAKEGIDDQAFSIGLDAEYVVAGKPLSAVIGGSWIGYSDNQKFSATTVGTGTGNNGDVRTQSSEASAFEIHGEYGLRHRFGPHNGGFFILRGGYLANLASDRSISNCSNCPSEDIDISGGAYGVAGLGFNAGQTFSMGLNYKHFATGDFDHSMLLELRWSSY